MTIAAGVTEDALLGGAVTLLQPARGYRVGIDTVLLADFAAGGRRARLAVDLGAGVGAVALLLAHRGAATSLALVEREPQLVELARRNVQAAAVDASIYLADLETMGLPRALAGRADLVVANPPFFLPGHHRDAEHPLSRASKHGSLEPFAAAAARALSGPRARAAFVYPARALEALLEASRRAGLVAKRLRLVHSTLDAPARVALCELRRARPGGLIVEPPLVEWRSAGRRSAEVERLLSATAARALDRAKSRRRRAR